MDKRIYIFIAVIAFFAGAIWVSEVPVVATLVAFLEVCAGFVCGYFFYKGKANEAIAKLTEEIKSVKEATKKVKEEITKTPATKSPVKSKRAKVE